MMVGRLLSFWDGIFSGAMLNFQGVVSFGRNLTFHPWNIFKHFQRCFETTDPTTLSRLFSGDPCEPSEETHLLAEKSAEKGAPPAIPIILLMPCFGRRGTIPNATWENMDPGGTEKEMHDSFCLFPGDFAQVCTSYLCFFAETESDWKGW